MKKQQATKNPKKTHLRCSPSRAPGSPRFGTACRRGRRARPRSPGGPGRRAGRATYFCSDLRWSKEEEATLSLEEPVMVLPSVFSAPAPFCACFSRFPSDECKLNGSTRVSRRREASKKESPSPRESEREDGIRVIVSRSFFGFFVHRQCYLVLSLSSSASRSRFWLSVVKNSRNAFLRSLVGPHRRCDDACQSLPHRRSSSTPGGRDASTATTTAATTAAFDIDAGHLGLLGQQQEARRGKARLCRRIHGD